MLKTFPSKKIIHMQQDLSSNVYLIKKGRVRLSILHKNGSEQSLTILEEGCTFGELSIFDDLPYFGTVTTIVECEIFVIPNKIFKQMLLTDEEFATIITKSFVRKIRILSSLIEALSFKTSYSRVASYVFELVHSHSDFISGTYKLNIKFTQQEMADLTGLSRVSVSQIMNYMRENEIIKRSNGYLIITNIGKLQEMI
jgi:CRP/FNR family cyclic AMP-dependent transcriptional regulator